jgi:hypothetical protein
MILEINPYFIVAILLIAGLCAVFFISYVLNKKTPVPKGCENLLKDEEMCKNCSNTSCKIKELEE